MITQAYILCGGLGTRLGSMTKDTPKPMLEVGGKPILAHTMELLKKQGFTKAILVAGYKADVVKEFFEDEDWGIDVEIFVEKDLVGTAGSMPLLKDKLDDNYLMIYGDVFLDFDVRAQCDRHEKEHAMATFLVGPSTHPWDSNLIQAKDGVITEFVNKKEKEPDRNYHNIGDRAVYVLNKKILDYIPEGKSDFMKDIFPKALAAGEKFITHELDPGQFVRDMGKPERFPIVEKHLKDREAIGKAREHPKPVKCVFLDRDGTINEEVNYLHRKEDISILPGVEEAMELFRKNGITTIVVTNQPVIARGMATEEEIEEINRIISEEVGGWDALYHCPHHPATQFGEGVEKLRRGCDCRKPANGMIMQAREEHNLDLAECVMIGDSFRDVEAGKNAGLRTILLKTGKGASKEGTKPDYEFDTLLDAAKVITGGDIQ